jgi:hypothetical protein
MTVDDDMDSSAHPILARITTVLLFLLVQAGAVLVVGLTALLLDVVPGWSTDAPLAAMTKPLPRAAAMSAPPWRRPSGQLGTGGGARHL